MANKNYNDSSTTPKEAVKNSGPASPNAGKMFSGSVPSCENNSAKKEIKGPKVSDEGKFEQV